MDVEGAQALAEGERGAAPFVGQLARLADAVDFAAGPGGNDGLVRGAKGFEAASPVEGGPMLFGGLVGVGRVGHDGVGLAAGGGAVWPVWAEAGVHEAWGDGTAFAMAEKLGCV